MQARQGVKRHHAIHVVLDVVVHVPIDELQNRINVHSAGGYPVVVDALGEACVLGSQYDPMDRCTCDSGEKEHQNRPPAPGRQGPQGDEAVNQQETAGLPGDSGQSSLAETRSVILIRAPDRQLNNAAGVVPNTVQIRQLPR